MPPNTTGPTPDDSQASTAQPGTPNDATEWTKAIDHLDELHSMRSFQSTETRNINGIVSTVEVNEARNIDGVISSMRTKINDVLHSNSVRFDDLGNGELFNRTPGKGSTMFAGIQATVNTPDRLKNALGVIESKMDPTVDGTKQKVRTEIARVVNESATTFKAEAAQRATANAQQGAIPQQTPAADAGQTASASTDDNAFGGGRWQNAKKNMLKGGAYMTTKIKNGWKHLKGGVVYGVRHPLKASEEVLDNAFFRKLNMFSKDFWLWDVLSGK